MVQDGRGHIWHTAITNFNVVFVAYLVKPVMFREMLQNWVQEFMANITGQQ